MRATASKTALAIDGGEPVRRKPCAPWPYFADDEIAAAVAIMRSGRVNYWTGEQGREFEREFAAACGCEHAVAVANGSVALELALHALGVGAGDEVVTASRTFIASASCAVMRGARPVLADVDRDTGNLSADTIRAALTRRTRAIVVVHLAGWPCDMDPILELARQRNLFVIEDCAQAQGATYKGRPVGTFGDAAAFSFCQDKIMTTLGEGGMFTTNSTAWWERAWSYKDHGKNYHAVYGRKHPPGFHWLHESFGTNWRLTDVQSAVGRVQLAKVPGWIDRRRGHARILNERLANIPALRLTVPGPEFGHVYYKYYLFLRLERLKRGWDRDRVMQAIQAEGIACFNGICSELYLEKAFASMRLPGRLPVARELGETSLMFLVHPTMDDDELEDTCRAIEKVMEAASL